MDPKTSLFVFCIIAGAMYFICALNKLSERLLTRADRQRIIKIVKFNGIILVSACAITLFINGCYAIYKVIS
ncbi:hypothetical protein D5W64_12510 [Salmonella enterica subsp. enterica serovar Saintpaul]|nr:hypothetical protein [Salmonella enterica subsp. enterica serovar Saintpaul]